MIFDNVSARRFGILAAFFVLNASGQAQEFRALWADAFHTGFKTSSQINQLIADLRAGNFNAVVVQVRKRGDAYYNSHFEPKAADISSAFDPLADLIAKAHATNNGPRIEVHAWIVSYHIWNNRTNAPSQPDHPYNLHPDWLTENSAGAQWDGSNYGFDPAHPEVQEHTFNVCMDIVSNYDVDGLNFDYIRYAGNTWGYNDVAVARFNAKHGRTGQPSSADELWRQFRRDQVTALVRKVYVSTMAVKPHVKISADTITWAPGVTTNIEWTNNARAYIDVLQDWRLWMQEGILDLNIPMSYFDQAGAYTRDWTNWNTFAKDRRFSRHLAIGPGIYLNSLSNALLQMRYTRSPSPAGNYADGLCGYSYAVPSNDGASRATFYAALTQTNTARLYDPNPQPLFVNRAAPPLMPWKTSPTKGHLKGFVSGGQGTNYLDGATVTLSGQTNRAQLSDATGFFGFVDLPPGNYTVVASSSGAGSRSSNVVVMAGLVTTADLITSTNDTTPPIISNVLATNITDSSATILWTTDEDADSLVRYGSNTMYRVVSNAARVANHSMNLAGLSASTMYYYRIRSRDAATNEAVSGDFTFTTNPSGVVSDIIIDNPAAAVVGSWSANLTSTDKYGSDYRYKSQGSGAAHLQFTPNILAPGNYAVYEWHPQGLNRTTNAPHVITFNGGTQTIGVNQKVSGGRWNLLGNFSFAAGTGGHVRITDGFPDGSQVVLADAIKFVYVPAAAAPTITSHPQSQGVKLGSNVTFSVAAGGTAPLNYQWRFNGSNIAGATGNSYTRTQVQTNDGGLYSVIVSNIAGVTPSSNATLTVLLPQPVRIESITLLADGRVRLMISGEPGNDYGIESSSNLTDWAGMSVLANTNGTFEFIDGPATNQLRRFYRVQGP